MMIKRRSFLAMIGLAPIAAVAKAADKRADNDDHIEMVDYRYRSIDGRIEFMTTGPLGEKVGFIIRE